MKTADLTGAALDWAVAKCEGFDYFKEFLYAPSQLWEQGGLIIESECMQLWKGGEWCASLDQSFNPPEFSTGTTPLIAAMRCYVASKLGTEIEVPEELLSCADE
jgi:hypothetical protein